MRDVVGRVGDEGLAPRTTSSAHLVGAQRDWRAEARRIERRHRLELIAATVTVLALTAAFLLVQVG